MNPQIIGFSPEKPPSPEPDFQDWLQSAAGGYMLAWERRQFDLAVSDVFGYHALQLGLPEIDTLQTNRMPHRCLAQSIDTPSLAQAAALRSRSALVTEFDALPFREHSLDLVTLPHGLELCPDPHAALAEVARVLLPEGRVIISGLNPASLWGFRQRRSHLYQRIGLGQTWVAGSHEWIGYWRLRDWLRLLSFEVESVRFGCYRPSFQNKQWLDRMAWMDPIGQSWWPIFGSIYFLVAVKRVRGMKLMGRAWKRHSTIGVSPVAAPVSVAGSAHQTSRNTENPIEFD
ncbi:MAG: methyltransferase domain-containing protein [Burkholderiaceae bacterium]|jgi:SAM-dependent methyltransferase|nr:methyltransferase domain-containing protein [Burkholderiaceae bacterium]